MLSKILDQFPKTEDYLIEILLKYQSCKEKKQITKEEIAMIAKHLNLAPSKVSSVVAFYTFFSTEERGQHIVQVCYDVPCYVTAEVDVLKTLEDLLGIKVGETTKCRTFTIEHTSCLGCCDEAPAMRIGTKTYTNLTKEKIKKIISEYGGKK